MNKSTIKAEKLPSTDSDKDKSVDKQIKKVLSKSQKVKLIPAVVGGSIGLGFLGAVLGAIIWYLVAAIFDLRIGYLAILVGIFVGYGMKILLKNANSLSLGLVAAALSLFGVLLGNFMIWYFESPKWGREYYISSGYQEEEIEEIPSSDFRKAYGFGSYMKEDLTSFEGGHNPMITWLFYVLALYVGFSRVFDIKNPNKSI